MITKDKAINADSVMPMEQQIGFLSQSLISFQVDTFEILREKLAGKGIEIFKTILRQTYKQAFTKVEGLDFQQLAKFMGISDGVMGFQMEMDYLKPDEFQYSITYCPYLEECKRKGLGMDFCNVLEEVGTEEINKNIGEATQPERMCNGDNKCTFRMRNTLGR